MPRTEADIKAAIDAGLLTESHRLDLKKMPASKGDNKEAARDMASFAIDSGTLIYGIAEDKTNRTFTFAPQPLDGLAEKLEQIALSGLIDPPLSILTDEIPCEADPTRGYLLVHIPASSGAPHMVDGRYYGRSDKTKYVLSDAEVLRLHDRRRVADQDALALLQHEIDNDPIPAEDRRQAHLFLIAQPLAGRRDMLVDLVGSPQWNQKLYDFVEHAFTPELNAVLNGTDVDPTLKMATNGFRRARAVARATPNLGEGRIFRPSDGPSSEDAIELQVHEDGGLRLFFSRFSDTRHGDFGRPDQNVLFDAAAVSCTRRFLALTLTAARTAGYFGNWALAFGATGLRGLRAYRVPSMDFAGRAQYSEDTYTETTSVSWAELNTAPGTATRRLIGPLLRSLEAEQGFAHALDDPAPESP